MTVREAVDTILKLPRRERDAVIAELLDKAQAKPENPPRARPGLDDFLARAGRGVADSPDVSSDKYADLREDATQ